MGAIKSFGDIIPSFFNYARLHDDKRGVCYCGYDLLSGVCIRNVCSKSMFKIKIGDEITDQRSCFADEFNDLVKGIVKDS